MRRSSAFLLPVLVLILLGAGAWNANLRDLSQTGLGLVVNRSFPPGTVLTIRLQTGSRKCSRTMLVRVKHSAAQPNGEWLVGCSFVVQLKEEELAELLA